MRLKLWCSMNIKISIKIIYIIRFRVKIKIVYKVPNYFVNEHQEYMQKSPRNGGNFKW